MNASGTLIANRYRLIRPIGQGGMGRVWFATDELLRRDVAVKEVLAPPGYTAAEILDMGRRALREARAAARLNHVNVVAVHDVVVIDTAPWIVMEYVPSRSLYDLVTADGPVSVAVAASIGLAVLAAVQAAHGNGVLHRDIKPGNVLIATDGRVVLTDFGLATIVGDPAVTRSGLVLGSPSYMAPERARDEEAGPAADLWSLGATLYFAVEGHSPYQRSSALSTIAALASEDPIPSVRSGALATVLAALLQREPTARPSPSTVEHLLTEAGGKAGPLRLRAVAGGQLSPQTPRGRAPVVREHATAAGIRPTGSGSVPPSSTRRRAIYLTSAAAALVATLTAGVVLSGNRTGLEGTAGTLTLPASTTAATNPASQSPSAPPVTSAAPTAPPASELRLPPGWHRYVDPTGFSVAIPDNWRVSRQGSIVYFREQNGPRYLGIDQTNQPKADPVADWTGKEAYRVERGDFPAYRRVSIREVRYFLKAADWEFTYLVDGVRVHVLNRGFVTSSTQAYGMWWSTPDNQWAANQSNLELIQRSFTPRS